MKPHRQYIIMCILSLLFLAGCRDEEPVQSAESKRTITVNLGIAMSRVAEKDQVAYGDANDMKVWLFDQKGRCVQYIPVEDPQFSGRDITGDPVESVSTEFDVTDVESLQFRVLLNTDGLNDANGNPLVLGGETTIDEIDGLTFQFGTTMPDGDNKVPMYGKEKEPITIDNKREYSVDIELVRAVGKLEVLFTKESEDSYLKINKVEITQGIPTKGYLAEVSDNDDRSYDEGSIMLFESEQEQEGVIDDDMFLPQSEASYGDFSLHADKFQSLVQEYLLENPNGKEWNDEKHDWTYPNVPDGETYCYVLQIDYQTLEGENPKSKNIYLPIIERNTWNKIFVRVKREEIDMEFELLVEPWHEIDIEVPPFV